LKEETKKENKKEEKNGARAKLVLREETWESGGPPL
jgi:hypothetical protein